MVQIQVKELSGFWQKSVGLIGKTKIYPVYFRTRWGIHTFGMRCPIDVVILEKNIITKLIKNLSPNRFLFWYPGYSQVLELPAGQIAKLGLRLQEELILKSV
jgi:uncharacterized membrane protein (UPF0127 family)